MSLDGSDRQPVPVTAMWPLTVAWNRGRCWSPAGRQDGLGLVAKRGL